MEGGWERAEVIGSAGDGGMAGFGIGGGHVSAIGKVDGPRFYHLEFGSETTSATGPKGFAIGQEDETAAEDNDLNCIIAGLTLDPQDPRSSIRAIRGILGIRNQLESHFYDAGPPAFDAANFPATGKIDPWVERMLY